MKKRQHWIFVLIALLLCLLAVSCQKEPVKESSLQQSYRMYYVKNQSKLVSETFSTELTETEDLIEEFVGALAKDSPNNVDNKKAITENTKVLKYVYDSGKKQIAMYFDIGYFEKRGEIGEILSRAAVVRTLTQISGVESVSFYVNEQPLVDASGKVISAMRASDFIEDLGGDINDYEKKTLTLYFSNSIGDKLIEEKREVFYTTSTSMARLVMEQLIAGPKTEGLFPVLPSDTKILNITVQEGVCYVNLDPSFLTSAVSTIELLPIYAMVNSLSELPTINKVQIAINGETNKKYREVVPLNELFERNLDLVSTLEIEQERALSEQSNAKKKVQ